MRRTIAIASTTLGGGFGPEGAGGGWLSVEGVAAGVVDCACATGFATTVADPNADTGKETPFYSILGWPGVFRPADVIAGTTPLLRGARPTPPLGANGAKLS